MKRTSFVVASAEDGISAVELSAIMGIIYTMAEKVEEALSSLTEYSIIWGIVPYLHNNDNEEPACTYSVSLYKSVAVPEALRVINNHDADRALMTVANVTNRYISAKFPLDMIEKNTQGIISLIKRMEE
ncbi:MAG: hypothetical protein CEO40_341 [Parcubacteria group bacterium LiPW_72]|nr:MAG: hypothetical protein CEO40_341 [Parcubacteria group bacterium LiPW_72]